MAYSPLRDGLVGLGLNQDRLWLLHTSGGTFAITEYNWELTGYSPELVEMDRRVFHYGGNAYYITGEYARNKGWRVEQFEDRVSA